MDNSGYIEIKIVGSKGKLDPAPDNYGNKEKIYYDPSYDEEHLFLLKIILINATFMKIWSLICRRLSNLVVK